MGLSSRPTYMPLVLPQSFITMRCKGPQVIVACHEVFFRIMMHRPGGHFYFLRSPSQVASTKTVQVGDCY